MTLDPVVLSELAAMVGDDVAFVGEIVDTYRADAATQLAGMDASLAAGDLETLGRHAHTLKGNSRTVGATTLAEMAAVLEAQAGAGNDVDAATRIKAARAEFERVGVELEAARIRGWRP
jgi:HPt (histidine-containing phosphotransfer) domain-containing protein